MSGFHRCVTCQAKLPASDPHEDCVACLGPEHAASALADRSFCASCANFQPRTLRQRARKAVGNHSPSSWSSYTLSVPPSSTATAVASRGSKSPSQLTAGQRSPDRRRAHERSHSPSVRPRGSSPRRERSRRSRSRSLSPRRRGRSRSPYRGGVPPTVNPQHQQEVRSTWGAPASSPATSRKASAFAMQGASEAGLASFPLVDAAFAALVKTPTLSGLVKDPACPNKQCRTTEIHLKKGYLVATEAVKLSNVASLLSIAGKGLTRAPIGVSEGGIGARRAVPG
ncbi:UNVERIFIED_CONTAM: hypothetical protein FKN15_040533 [Acipenser sinensis]